MKIESGKLIYEQIYEEYRRLIEVGALKKGESLPSVREVALGLDVNPNTVQRAYARLQDDGYIESISKKGNIVCYEGGNAEAKRASYLEGQIESLLEKGYTASEISACLRKRKGGSKQ